MPITIERTGGAGLAGISAGLQQATQNILKEDRAKELAQFESDIQLEKEKSRIAYAHELDLQSEIAAQQWELDKMKLRSQLDFQQEELERQKIKDQATVGLNALDKAIKSGQFNGDEPEIQRLQLQYQLQKETGQLQTHVQSLREPMERASFSAAPWYMRPEYKDTPEGIAARDKAESMTTKKPISVVEVRRRLAAILGGNEMVIGQTIPEMLSDAESQGIDTSTLFDDFDMSQFTKETTGSIENSVFAKPTSKYTIGQIISKAGKKWKVVGFDKDGEPLVDEVK